VPNHGVSLTSSTLLYCSDVVRLASARTYSTLLEARVTKHRRARSRRAHSCANATKAVSGHGSAGAMGSPSPPPAGNALRCNASLRYSVVHGWRCLVKSTTQVSLRCRPANLTPAAGGGEVLSLAVDPDALPRLHTYNDLPNSPEDVPLTSGFCPQAEALGGLLALPHPEQAPWPKSSHSACGHL
jgi:hypothetical protein